ncbi:MAG: potassium/proton antiporter [Bacteroidales bacterium]|nr:potassium/proton antiporter [Bacteroidales bacterium]
MIPLSVFSVNLGTENLLLLASILVFIAILITKVGARFGAPTLLLFLLLGMAAGADGLGVTFEDYELSESIGHFAMAVILFTSGIQTSFKETKPVMRQGILLSSLGVFLTMLLTGLFIFMLAGRDAGYTGTMLVSCILMAAIMSSTDSNTVFSVLHNKRLHLRENLSPLLELESGSNDPMAYVLTILLVRTLETHLTSDIADGALAISGIILLVLQVLIGFGIGVAVGRGSAWLLNKITLPGNSLFAILLLSIGFFANGLASLLFGNGLLALYVTAIILGNRIKLPQKKDTLKFFDGMSWLMQLLMFLMLGLLARPSQMGNTLLPALLIGLFLIFIARPASVFLTLLPFRSLSFKAKAYVSWVGLKGAGPILFALYPVVNGLEGSSLIFNMVFCITLLSLVIQGFTLAPAAKLLKLSYEEEPEVETFGMELPEEMGILRDHTVTEADLAHGNTMRDLHLPHGIRVVMVKREERFLVPHGSMELKDGDHLVIVMGDTDD